MFVLPPVLMDLSVHVSHCRSRYDEVLLGERSALSNLGISQSMSTHVMFVFPPVNRPVGPRCALRITLLYIVVNVEVGKDRSICLTMSEYFSVCLSILLYYVFVK